MRSAPSWLEPDKEVYALVGDGSFMMLNSEIPTAMQENAKITVVVFDNCAFGCINNPQMGNGVGSLATEMRHRNETTGKLDGDYCYTDFGKIGEGFRHEGVLRQDSGRIPQGRSGC